MRMPWSGARAVTIFVAVLLGCTGETSGAEAGDAGAKFPEAPLATVKTASGALSVAVRSSPQPPTRGILSVEYVITDAAGKPRDDLSVAVVPWMPDMGHGASTKPTVVAEGNGRYVIEGLSLFMPGRWDLRTTVGGGVSDSATIELQIP